MSHNQEQLTFDEKARGVMRQYGCDYYQACSILSGRSARKRAAMTARAARMRDAAAGRQSLPPGDR